MTASDAETGEKTGEGSSSNTEVKQEGVSEQEVGETETEVSSSDERSNETVSNEVVTVNTSITAKSDKQLYKFTLTVIGCEPKQIWIQSPSRDEATHHVKYNVHPRATIRSIDLVDSPPEHVSTVHEVTDGNVKAKRLRH
mgnify:FL=1